jgi:hypothetical protein|tara:strand:+ start:577 stop:897 length:321 start_codon:yes stop_codon:yes gene_type:complete
MYPHERSLVSEYASRPFAIIGVNSDKDREVLKERILEESITWRSFWNGGSTSGPISTQWNVSGWPTLYLIDHEGVIRHKGLRGDLLDEALKELVPLAEKALETGGR